SADVQTFSGTISNGPDSTFSGLGVSTSVSPAFVSVNESASEAHDITETVPAGFALDGYTLVADAGVESAGRCFPNDGLVFTSTGPSVTVPADGLDYVVCIQNHRTRDVHIVKEVENHPGDTTPFKVSLNGTTLPGGISDSGDFIDVTVNADILNVFTEDTPLPAGYHFAFGTDNGPSANFRCEPEENPLEGTKSLNGYELEPGGTGPVTICLVNDQDPDVTLTKTANPPGPVVEGNPIGFDITVSNSGGGIAGILVTDNLDQSADLHLSVDPPVSGCTITGADGAQLLHCSVIQLLGSETIHISSPTNANVCGSIENTATWLPRLEAQVTGEAQVQDGGSSDTATVTIDCGGSLTVTKHTLTNGIPDGSAVAFPWTFTVSSAACHYTSAPTVTVGGVANFTSLPACSDYAVTESGSLHGYVPIGSTPSSGSISVTEGGSTNVSYLNVRQVDNGCPEGQLCTPPPPPSTPTPTATPATPPTATVPTPTATTAPPTATPVAPTAQRTTANVVLGEKTPGPTPRAPSTGSGSGGSSPFNFGLVFAALVALSGGFAALSVARRRREL
ncbi:MAG: hypothetical protein ACRDG3_02335, partial [Tepidiformaceae bacterium]